MLKVFCDHLATALSLTLGQTLHYGYMPPGEPALATALLERVSTEPDPYNKAVRVRRYQIYTRAPAYRAAEDECRRIFEYAIQRIGLSLTGWYIYHITGSEPASIGLDERGRFAFSANISVTARKA
jgi:hypothetical protein